MREAWRMRAAFMRGDTPILRADAQSPRAPSDYTVRWRGPREQLILLVRLIEQRRISFAQEPRFIPLPAKLYRSCLVPANEPSYRAKGVVLQPV